MDMPGAVGLRFAFRVTRFGWLNDRDFGQGAQPSARTLANKLTSKPQRQPNHDRALPKLKISFYMTMSAHSNPSAIAELERISQTLRTIEPDNPAVSPIRG